MRHVPSDHPAPLVRRFAPLRLVAARLALSSIPADAFFDPDDFLCLSWAVDRPSPVKVFKHVDTRALLNLDTNGVAYRAEGAGRYVRHATLRDAVDALGLWELPWLRPELAEHRRGRSWDERFELYEELTGNGLDRAS